MRDYLCVSTATGTLAVLALFGDASRLDGATGVVGHVIELLADQLLALHVLETVGACVPGELFEVERAVAGHLGVLNVCLVEVPPVDLLGVIGVDDSRTVIATVVIDNFLGEKAPRQTEIHGDTEVAVDGEELTLSGPNIEDVGQTAADIEQLTRVSGKDTRVFQDGVYITKKPKAGGA